MNALLINTGVEITPYQLTRRKAGKSVRKLFGKK